MLGFGSGALGMFHEGNDVTRGVLNQFWACLPTTFLELRMCVKSLWGSLLWVELYPPTWIC